MNSTDMTLLANLLMSQHGDNAREYAKKKMWECRHNKDADGTEKWGALMEAVKQAKAG